MTAMRIGSEFVIANSYSYFCFFVDDDSSSWSKTVFQARRFKTEAEAEPVIEELRRRNREKRKQRGKP